jgi:hypothetical protein
MHPHRFVVAALVAAALLTAACGSTRSAPTPTPTKTPVNSSAIAVAAIATPAPPPTDTPTPEPPTPTPTPSNLAPYTGLPASDPALLKQHPVFICINNDAAGRAAHFGLSYADVIYEYIVDGFALTRMTALYQSQNPARVGPVRSARFPNIWLVHMYDGILMCSGGSDAIRYLLKNEVGFPYLDADIDDPQNNVYFQSLGSDYRTRMQGSPDGARRWIADRLRFCANNPASSYCAKVLNNWTGGDWIVNEWNRPGFAFSDEPPEGAAGPATTINITYPGGNSVQWRYDAAQGGYLRVQGGVQAVDPATGRPILASNVIVAAATHELTNIIEDTAGTRGVDVKLYGFGDLRVFRDGQVYEGTWRADDRTPPRWLGPGDVLVELKPGHSWVQVVQRVAEMTYQ